jgi:spore coat protein JB
MPACAPLAVPYVPFQQKGSKRYNPSDALNNGPLYPALNLPFHLKVDAPNAALGPLGELQALDFVVHELVLYLDTHPDDAEAFELYKQYAAMAKEARKEYTAAYGPLMNMDPGDTGSYAWIKDPWPWNHAQKGWDK